MKNFTDKIFNGDCLKVLPKLPKNSVALIVTSPPYAQKRKKSYDGVAEGQYVEWFLPIARFPNPTSPPKSRQESYVDAYSGNDISRKSAMQALSVAATN